MPCLMGYCTLLKRHILMAILVKKAFKLLNYPHNLMPILKLGIFGYYLIQNSGPVTPVQCSVTSASNS